MYNMEPKVEVIISGSPRKVAKAVAKAFIRMVQQSGQHRFDIALSGGSTPKKLFSRIAEKYRDAIDWSRIHFWWGDERCVPPDSIESNYRMAYETMISQLPVKEEQIHRIHGEEDPDAEAERYSQEIIRQLNSRKDLPVFDLVILGMGEDGHTASIFPGRMDLLTSDSICAVATHPASNQKRITLTGQVINNANAIFFLATGSNKARRISEIMNNEASAGNYPAFHIIPEHGNLVWFIDEEASGKI